MSAPCVPEPVDRFCDAQLGQHGNHRRPRIPVWTSPVALTLAERRRRIAAVSIARRGRITSRAKRMDANT